MATKKSASPSPVVNPPKFPKTATAVPPAAPPPVVLRDPPVVAPPLEGDALALPPSDLPHNTFFTFKMPNDWSIRLDYVGLDEVDKQLTLQGTHDAMVRRHQHQGQVTITSRNGETCTLTPEQVADVKAFFDLHHDNLGVMGGQAGVAPTMDDVEAYLAAKNAPDQSSVNASDEDETLEDEPPGRDRGVKKV